MCIQNINNVDMTADSNIAAITRRLHFFHVPYFYDPSFLYRHNNLESALHNVASIANKYEVDQRTSEATGVKNRTKILFHLLPCKEMYKYLS